MTTSPLRRIPSVGLRNRVIVTFGAGALVLSIVLAFTTYSITKSNLLKQRETASIISPTSTPAVQHDLDCRMTNAGETLPSLDHPKGCCCFAMSEHIESSLRTEPLPPLLQARVIDDLVASRMIINHRGSRRHHRYPIASNSCRIFRTQRFVGSVQHAAQCPPGTTLFHDHHHNHRSQSRSHCVTACRSATCQHRCCRSGDCRWEAGYPT